MLKRCDLSCVATEWKTAERRFGEQVTRERRYYIMSLAGNAHTFGEANRSQWGSKMACIECSISLFKKMAARCTETTVSRILWSYVTWPTIGSKRNRGQVYIKARWLKAGWSKDCLRKVQVCCCFSIIGYHVKNYTPSSRKAQDRFRLHHWVSTSHSVTLFS